MIFQVHPVSFEVYEEQVLGVPAYDFLLIRNSLQIMFGGKQEVLTDNRAYTKI